MKKIFVLGTAVVFAFPSVSLAANYQYIDLVGKVVTIEAENASAALMLSSNNSLRSGVKSDPITIDAGKSFGISFRYVDIIGKIKTIIAASADEAMILAADIAAHSGVMAATSKAE